MYHGRRNARAGPLAHARVACGGDGTTASLRRQFFSMPGRLVRSARRQRLRLSQDWPWRQHFIDALDRLRKIPPPILA